MMFADRNDMPEILGIFKQYKGIFPYVRKDYLQRNIDSGNVIFQEHVAIIFKVYKRVQRIGTAVAKKDDISISELVSGSMKGFSVFEEFIRWIGPNTSIWGTIRADNKPSIWFHEKVGFVKVGDIAWKEGTIPGVVYCRKGKNV